MKLANFGHPQRIGAVSHSKLVDLNLAYASYAASKSDSRPYATANSKLPAQMDEFLRVWKDAVQSSEEALDFVARKDFDVWGPSGERVVHNIGDVKVWAPIPGPSSRIFCSVANYSKHVYAASKIREKKRGIKSPYASAQDCEKSIRSNPYTAFQKWPQYFVGNDEPRHVPGWIKYLDYECEIVAYIGKELFKASASEARNSIAGYSVMNDWSVRDQGAIEGAEQFNPPGALSLNLAKNIAGGSLGPYLVVDEVSDPYHLKMKTTVNGKIRQDAVTGEMVRKFDEIIVYISRFLRLYPGDIIAAGTCAGTAVESLDPAVSLHDGDVVECSVEKVGTLRNKVHFDPY